MGLAKIFSLNYSRQIRQEVVLTNQIATVNSKLLVPVFYRLYLVSVSRLAQISFSELGCLFARLRKSRKAKSPSPKACFFYSLQFYSPLLQSSPLHRPPPPPPTWPLPPLALTSERVLTHPPKAPAQQHHARLRLPPLEIARRGPTNREARVREEGHAGALAGRDPGGVKRIRRARGAAGGHGVLAGQVLLGVPRRLRRRMGRLHVSPSAPPP
jgi:hypothetical protein